MSILVLVLILVVMQSADRGGGDPGQVPGQVEREGGEDEETHQSQEPGLSRPQLYKGKVGQTREI